MTLQVWQRPGFLGLHPALLPPQAVVGRLRHLDGKTGVGEVTAAIHLSRFTSRPFLEIYSMGGITLQDFTQSVASR